ncbi:hypothetical protein [Solibacillus sp. FSL K6-1126]|uniref:hypothetical protein n=1 Tax=Solibacillus sp. FSL K6-1126 TaxID=2921463 RepID=UPI0030F95A58
MKRYLNVAIGLLSLFLLSGCFGEDYDFSPPTVMIITPNGIDIQEALAEANIDWKYDDKYNKETEDIQELAEMQNIIYFESRELVALNMESFIINRAKELKKLAEIKGGHKWRSLKSLS